MSGFTSALIAWPTLINIALVLWLLWWTSKRRGGEAETTGHTWDGDLQELNKPLPRWWLGLFIITVVFGLAYLALYPGLGNFKGRKQWTQISQYEEQSRQAEALLARTFAPYEKASLDELEKNAGAMRIGRNLFLNNCAGCHGSDGRGATGFPNLTDKDWLWGGQPETVLASIQNGRIGAMPPWQAALGEGGVYDVTGYVMSLSGRQPVNLFSMRNGKATFEQTCVACHGADGKGNSLLGAPNLTDSIWLHGGSEGAIVSTIANGHQGQMPAQLERLGETRTKLLAAYVLHLGQENAGP